MTHYLLLLVLTLYPSSNILQARQTRQTFIVRVRHDSNGFDLNSVEDWYASILKLQLKRTPPSKPFIHLYRTAFHGFSIPLTPLQAGKLRSHPSIIGVTPDAISQLHTTRTPQFLHLTTKSPHSRPPEPDFGSDVIIGMLDTGIWPERQSFHDEGLPPVPARWKGECVEGENFTKSNCNRKIIGARYFTDGYLASLGPNHKTGEIKSARDTEGHGTHTASIAAGRQVMNASFYGLGTGSYAVGMAPKARLAVYKVCWLNGCADSDLLAAIDKAVEDGVDVISLSIGSGPKPFNQDNIALGAFAAMQKGVFVSASAGNDGPQKGTLSNVAPWIMTVGASSIDRDFPAQIVLENGMVLNGSVLYTGRPLPSNDFIPIIYAGNAVENGSDAMSAGGCLQGSLNPKLVRGKIVVCDRGFGSQPAKGRYVKDAGGVGMVVSNMGGQGDSVIAYPHILPGLNIGDSDGFHLKNYLASDQNPRAKLLIHGTRIGVTPAPVVAAFQSRGPNPDFLNVLKPDVIAPGVNILAAWSGAAPPAQIPDDTRRPMFNIISGTSMSCPHVSGLAALLKGVHRDWSPAMIRSALMTTAYTRYRSGQPLLDGNAYTEATVWDVGSGHVDPLRATDPGLVYDLTVQDYLNFLCSIRTTASDLALIAHRPVMCPSVQTKPTDLNYPSIAVVFDQLGSGTFEATVRRTVTHTSVGVANYTVSVSNPKGVLVRVSPAKLVFKNKGEKQSYEVRISTKKVELPGGNVMTRSGLLTWTDGKRWFVSPLAVVFSQPF